MKLTIQVLTDPIAGFKQRRFMERYLWIGTPKWVRNFMDRVDIISTCLPLSPPHRNELMSELTDIQKSEILYDALPHYYIKKMKEANKTPIEMLLEKLFQFALNIEEAAVNPGKRMLREMPRAAKKQTPKPQLLEIRGVGKVKTTSNVEVSPLQLWKVKKHQIVICVVNKAIVIHYVALRLMPRPLLRKTKGKNCSLEERKSSKAQHFCAAARASNKKDDYSDDEEESDEKAFMSSFIESWTLSKKK
jgi:hypothetical protein